MISTSFLYGLVPEENIIQFNKLIVRLTRVYVAEAVAFTDSAISEIYMPRSWWYYSVGARQEAGNGQLPVSSIGYLSRCEQHSHRPIFDQFLENSIQTRC
jgi:hypothetical protein